MGSFVKTSPTANQGMSSRPREAKWDRVTASQHPSVRYWWEWDKARDSRPESGSEVPQR